MELNKGCSEGEEGEGAGLNPCLSQQEANRWCCELTNEDRAQKVLCLGTKP